MSPTRACEARDLWLDSEVALYVTKFCLPPAPYISNPTAVDGWKWAKKMKVTDRIFDNPRAHDTVRTICRRARAKLPSYRTEIVSCRRITTVHDILKSKLSESNGLAVHRCLLGLTPDGRRCP